jgi:hypothetical protein
MVRLIYITITSHISVLKHNLLIFPVLHPTGISSYKASNKQVLINLLYISCLFLITAINISATYVVNIIHVFCLDYRCTSILDPSTKKLIVITKYRWNELVVVF